MRVALVGTGVQAIPPVGYGGVERTIAELATALRAAGHDPVVLNHVRHGRSTDEYLFALSVPRLVRSLGADAVHASTPVVANRLALAGIPFVYTSHSRHWFELSGARQRFGFWLERRAVARSRVAIALTEPLHAEMVRRVPAAAPRVQTIPLGVDTTAFRPEPSARSGRAALGVGIVRPMKRWEVAARAASAAGWSFRLAGPTPDGAYAAHVRAAGSTTELLGELTDDELRREYAHADVLLHPSRVEILAGAVLQGLAAGLPIVGASPVAGLVDEGVTGWTAPPGTGGAELETFFTGKLARLQDAVARTAMGQAARTVAEQRYGWPAVVERHIAVYRAVAAPRTP